MLHEVRDELKSEFTSLRCDLTSSRSEFTSLKGELTSLKGEFTSLRVDMNAGFSKIDAKFEKLISEIHHTRLQAEEQRANNRYVLDGYQSLYDRQERVEDKVKNPEIQLINLKKKDI